MIRIECQSCGRYSEREGEIVQQKGVPQVSNAVCARCSCCKPEFRFELPVEELRNDFKETIRIELESGVMWQGENTSNYPEENVKFYEELLSEVKREREGREGGRT